MLYARDGDNRPNCGIPFPSVSLGIVNAKHVTAVYNAVTAFSCFVPLQGYVVARSKGTV